MYSLFSGREVNFVLLESGQNHLSCHFTDERAMSHQIQNLKVKNLSLTRGRDTNFQTSSPPI